MFPTLSEWFRTSASPSGRRSSTSGWRRSAVLLFLTGVGPLIAWRKATPSNLRYQFTYPLIAMAVVMVGCFVFGLHKRESTPTSG